MAQPSVFEQVIKLISRSSFEGAVARFGGDKSTRQLDCWTWFGALLFGQLSGHDSIRAIERVFGHGNKSFAKLGFQPICRSTLADANRTRPLEILEETYFHLLKTAKQLFPYRRRLDLSGDVFALDSTIIELCLNLSPWANFRRETAGVKLHTAIDLAGDLPDFFVITEAKRNDVAIAQKHYQPTKGSTIVMDRGYWSARWLNQLNQDGVYFVTRQRRNNKFRVAESRSTNRTQGYIYDQIVYQRISKQRTNEKYRGKLRRVKFNDPDTGKTLIFITNRFDLSTEMICQLYKARWQVELFFKTLKQNLRVKKFLGTSAHSVKAQILVALIAYLLVQIIRFQTKSSISIPDTMAVLGTLILLKEPLSRLLGIIPRVTRHPPPFQISFNI